uniref:Uncharacterized protein n=1 Tax=Manihot esculenta TaxID=3983 RepID=A0A2C9U3N2_MANES
MPSHVGGLLMLSMISVVVFFIFFLFLMHLGWVEHLEPCFGGKLGFSGTLLS